MLGKARISGVGFQKNKPAHQDKQGAPGYVEEEDSDGPRGTCQTYSGKIKNQDIVRESQNGK